MTTEDEPGGAYFWTTKYGETACGSEEQILAAVERGDIGGVDFDATTGLYSWKKQPIGDYTMSTRHAPRTQILLVAPPDAEGVEAIANTDGTNVFKWVDLDGGTFWRLTSSPANRAVHVEVHHYHEVPPPDMPEVLGVLQWVLQYSSGLNVTINVIADGEEHLAA